jgi:hypothetical protein
LTFSEIIPCIDHPSAWIDVQKNSEFIVNEPYFLHKFERESQSQSLALKENGLRSTVSRDAAIHFPGRTVFQIIEKDVQSLSQADQGMSLRIKKLESRFKQIQLAI